jgi:thiol:disulfide interchange protein DsbD
VGFDLRFATLKREMNIFLLKVAAFAALAGFVHAVTLMFLGRTILYLVPGILVAAGVYLNFFDRTRIEAGEFFKRGVALLFAAVAVWLIAPSSEGAVIPWQEYDPQLVAAAQRGSRPVMIDFTSRTCQPCRDMERDVFSRRAVARAAEPFLALRADLTEDNTANRALADQFGVKAFPTIVFFGADGKERANLRLVGYERAESFVQRLEQAR